MRLREINVYNVILCFCVIVIHLTSGAVLQMDANSLWYGWVFWANKMLCFAVPAFLFLSGFKMHNKYKNEKVNLKLFYLKRLKKIYLPYLACFVVYFLYYLYKGYVECDFVSIIKYILSGSMAAHFYYLVIAFQCYLIFPFLFEAFKRYPKTVCFVSLVCTVIFKQYVVFNYSDRFIGGYIFYFVLGMTFSKLYEQLSRMKKQSGILIFALNLIVMAIHVWRSYLSSAYGIFYPYAEIVNIIYVSLTIFSLYRIIVPLISRCEVVVRWTEKINKRSYSIYLYHVLVIQLLYWEVFSNFNLSMKWEFVISSAIVFGLVIVYGNLRFFNAK